MSDQNEQAKAFISEFNHEECTTWLVEAGFSPEALAETGGVLPELHRLIFNELKVTGGIENFVSTYDDGKPAVKYPEITVDMVGEDGNAFAILGKVQKALAKHGVSTELRDRFFDEATSGDYDHLLATCMKWVNVE